MVAPLRNVWAKDTPGVPVIFVSGYAASLEMVAGLTVRGFENGFTYLREPFIAQQLLEAIRTAFRTVAELKARRDLIWFPGGENIQTARLPKSLGALIGSSGWSGCYGIDPRRFDAVSVASLFSTAARAPIRIHRTADVADRRARRPGHRFLHELHGL
jgi:hypothetical protein